jgi:membrane protein implicated in regulation of membrane protease activity
MNTCVYDCGMFSVTSGGATVIYYLLSFWLAIISFAILVGVSIYIFIRLSVKG